MPQVLDGRWPARDIPSEPHQQRVRCLLDKLQVLCLSKPAVALWVLEFLETFINRQLNN